MQQNRRAAEDVIRGLATTSARIRALAEAKYDRTEIAKFLKIRYQHVRKVLLDAGIVGGMHRLPRAVVQLVPDMQSLAAVTGPSVPITAIFI